MDWLERSRSYVTTDGQSVSQYVLVSSTLVGLATRYFFLSECCCLKFALLFLWGALSDERTGLQFAVQLLIGPSRAEPVTILYCLIWDSSQPGGPGSCIYIPEEQGGPVIHPATGFPLRRLLRLARLWWRYSNPPPTWKSRSPYIYSLKEQDGPVQSQNSVTTDGQSISMSWCLVHSANSRLNTIRFRVFG
jgi:hypothetical protein